MVVGPVLDAICDGDGASCCGGESSVLPSVVSARARRAVEPVPLARLDLQKPIPPTNLPTSKTLLLTFSFSLSVLTSPTSSIHKHVNLKAIVAGRTPI